MTRLTAAPPLFANLHSLRRFSVAEYHQMIQSAILTDEDKVELLEGYVVLKMPRNPPHDGTIDLLKDVLPPLVPAGWLLRVQQAVTLTASEPEPDFAFVQGNKRSFLARHPTPSDIGLVIEVADSSLDRDRNEKGAIYARDGIPTYWIVNLVDRRIEVRTVPGSAGGQPAYTQQQAYGPGDAIPLVIGGVTVATIPVQDLLP